MNQMNPLNYELHVHTEESKNDSAASVSDMLHRMKELGVKKCAITEHGVVSSYDTALSVGKELGIDVILGVEAYVRLREDSPEGRCHMCLFSKDEIGNEALFQAVSDSNLNREKTFPVMNADILAKYFAKGTKGHGHVIASSACIGGVLSNILRQNVLLEKRIQKAQKKLKDAGCPEVDEDAIAATTEHINALSQEIDSLETIAKKKYGRRKIALRKLEGTDGYEAQKAALEKEEHETEQAILRQKMLKQEKKETQKILTQLNKQKRKAEEVLSRAKKQVSEIEYCNNNKKSEEELYLMAKKRTASFEKLFGTGNFYVELQYHGMPEEASVMPQLAEIAKELNIPVLITNDAHMAIAGEDSVRARQIMRSIRYISNKKPGKKIWQEAGDADKELYIKTEEELREMLQKILPNNVVEEGIENRGRLLEQCKVVVNQHTHYPKYPSEVPGETSEDCLRRKVKEGILERFPKGFPDERYQPRIEHELDVMCSMGFADYHLIVADYVQYGKLVGKFDFEHLPEGFEEHKFDIPWLKEKSKGLLGSGIGPGRGSAAGSEVCYLLKITDIDPLKYDLLFERFLNPERVSMPDIDTDFAPHLREICYDYVENKYGKERTCRILTRSRQRSRAAIDNCSKLLGDRLCGNTTEFQRIADTIKSMVVDSELPVREDVASRYESNKKNQEIALQIYDDACLVNNTFTFYGAHPAGVVISDDRPIKMNIPLMYDSESGKMKAQCDMVQVEECHGLLKMDFLGLKNLNIITNTVRMIQRNHGISINIEQIPFEKEVFENIYAKGFTNGVFQVESQGMKQMLRQAHPTCIEDVIILISMYRPGPMDFLDDLIQVMNGRKKATYLVPELEPILGKTYGAIVYQEQVMQIFQELAGYSLGGADMVRRYMSKKKQEKLAHEKEAFLFGDASRRIKGCVANGIPEEKARVLFEQMEEFAKYAFNKSHAAAYAIVSYQTAYLKYHYPKEFLSVSLGAVPSSRRKGFASDAKTLGFQVVIPDINESEVDFAVKDNCIYYGLSYVLNVGTKAEVIVKERRENGPFRSLADFVARTLISGNVLKHLILSGAFDKIQSQSRTALAKGAESFAPMVKLISDNRKKLTNESSSEKVKENAKAVIQNAIEVLEMTAYSKDPESAIERLRGESEYLGMMLSGHPCNDYPDPTEVGVVRISDLIVSKHISCMGAITNLRVTRRKSDGKEMAFFDLDMPDASIPVCVFAKEYEKFSNLIQEYAVVKITGSISEKTDKAFSDEDSDEEDTHTHLEMFAKKVEALKTKQRTILLYAPAWTKEEWKAFRKEMDSFIVKDGYPLHIYDSTNNRFFRADFNVSNDILSSRFETSFM